MNWLKSVKLSLFRHGIPQELEIISIYAEYSAKKKKYIEALRKQKFPLNKNPPDTK